MNRVLDRLGLDTISRRLELVGGIGWERALEGNDGPDCII